ncbi:MAG TPA: hypothetical protein VE548_05050 [Nitrososphaeraceae archaeon]|nr:hypothetical protein [Nitrososphaeraceae archaeon]
MRTTIQCVLIIGIVLVIIFVIPGNHLSFSQNSTVPFSPIPTETINIVNPVTTQNVSSQDGLIISGQSSDNNIKNCSVSVIVNDVRPYQNAVAKGSGGATDFSAWEFVLHNTYTHINEGVNKITSKLLCAAESPRWYSVFVNGVPNSSNADAFSPAQSGEQQQNISTTNLSGANEIDGIQTEEQQQQQQQQNIPTTNLSGANEIDSNNNELQVSILPLKNPVERGDTQDATITVTDSGSRPVANVEINGKLIYPGENFVKDFSGITDSQGKFVYSWIIGKKGDVGALSIEVDVSSQGYPPTSAKGSFDIVDNS